MFTILILACPLHFFVGFYIGKMLERVAWNKLIEDGKLPPPKRKG